ncbi:MAG: asparagine synthase C-terminal domain-containing protein [Thermoplasmata archaeon]
MTQDMPIDDIQEIGSKLADALLAVTAYIPERSAIAFSGGLDSSILLFLSPKSIHPYVVGLPGSMDVRSARESASLLKKDITIIEANEDQILKAAVSVKKIDPDIVITDLGFETVLYLTLSGISEDLLVTGQGADEIFYGYHRFLTGDAVTNLVSIEKLLKITLPREKMIADSLGKKILTPYLDPEIMKYSSFDPSTQIKDGKNKLLLRAAGAKLGIPDAVCKKAKKAAQYGSGVDKVLRKNRELLF